MEGLDAYPGNATPLTATPSNWKSHISSSVVSNEFAMDSPEENLHQRLAISEWKEVIQQPSGRLSALVPFVEFSTLRYRINEHNARAANLDATLLSEARRQIDQENSLVRQGEVTVLSNGIGYRGVESDPTGKVTRIACGSHGYVE